MLITKFKFNEPCPSPCALHTRSWINLHTLYSLHTFKFLWTYILIGTPCYLSNWLIWYDWMNGTMLFLAKYLRFLFKKNIKSSIACLLKLIKIPTKAKVRFSWSNPHMQFDFALSFVKFFDPGRNLSYSHDQDHVHVHSHAILLHSKIANIFIHPQNKISCHTTTLSL